MIKVIITGAGGRMGCRLISLVKESTSLSLSGAVESKGHRAVGE
ncbi:MAG: 4-hydroxy-tetrahydrodipicolinate reductase, partial [Nitrospiraceae bacterium]